MQPDAAIVALNEALCSYTPDGLYEPEGGAEPGRPRLPSRRVRAMAEWMREQPDYIGVS